MTMTAFPTVRDAVRRLEPSIWTALHPRTHAGAAGWCEAAVPAAALGGVCAANAAGVRDGPGELALLTAGLLARHRVPTFHVGRGLLDAAAHTDPPDGTKWTDLTFPFPAGVFLLPAGAVADGAGRRYGWVSWARLTPDAPVKVHGQWESTAGVLNEALVFCTASADDPEFMCLTASYAADSWPFAAPPSDMPHPFADGQPFTVADATVVQQLAGLAVNLLTLLGVRPELVEPSPGRTRTVKGAKAAPSGPALAPEEWAPNWVGRGYVAGRPESGDTHASPRLHWRRGHWRRQPHGTGRREVKLLWIEPVLVG